MTTAVKICGITRVEDALAAARLGAHAIGIIFYPKSPRYIPAKRAAEIVRALPPFVTAVGLFVNPEQGEVERVLSQVPLGLLQFHGDENAQFCEQFRVPYLKAARVRPALDLLQYAQRYGAARGLLLDAYVENKYGGTGSAFDWSLVPPKLALPVVLSGGLNPENVAEAIKATLPAAVDVSSGVETAPGIKDPRKLAAFFEGVRNALV